MRLTLRTLLAYLDDTLPPAEAATIGSKLNESESAKALVEKIRKLTRKRSLATPPTGDEGSASDPNTVAEYLGDALNADIVNEFEEECLKSEVHLAEVAACHQILTLLLSEPARVPPTARKRLYELVSGPESLPNRKPNNFIPVGGVAPEVDNALDRDAGLLLGMSNHNNRPILYLIAGSLMCVCLLAVWLSWPDRSQSSLPKSETISNSSHEDKKTNLDNPPESKDEKKAESKDEKKVEPETKKEEKKEEKKASEKGM